jgi:hypothetical protein
VSMIIEVMEKEQGGIRPHPSCVAGQVEKEKTCMALSRSAASSEQDTMGTGTLLFRKFSLTLSLHARHSLHPQLPSSSILSQMFCARCSARGDKLTIGSNLKTIDVAKPAIGSDLLANGGNLLTIDLAEPAIGTDKLTIGIAELTTSTDKPAAGSDNGGGARLRGRYAY